MIVAISGTPGSGKTSLAKILKDKGYKILNLNEIADREEFILEVDKKRDSKIVDIDKLDRFVEKKYSQEEDVVFVESHLSHLLKYVDLVIILRCHPRELKNRLSDRNWSEEKTRENIEAEVLDVILCEAVDVHEENKVFEIDTTDSNLADVVSAVVDIVKDKDRKRYNIGDIDWSDEIFKK
ncbi:MAG: adenylate kinase family protein [Candidatus Thermoplasmatota archaeon]